MALSIYFFFSISSAKVMSCLNAGERRAASVTRFDHSSAFGDTDVADNKLATRNVSLFPAGVLPEITLDR
jgi:hypothetical protein